MARSTSAQPATHPDTTHPDTTDRSTSDGGTADHDADVARARAGDQAAWSALVRRYERLLRHVARGFRLSGDDVEDVVQQTWLIGVERLHQLQDDSCFGSWLATVCRHEALRHVHRSRRCEPVEPDSEVLRAPRRAVRGGSPQEGDVADALAHDEDLANLRRAIDALPPRQRDVLRALCAADFDDYASTARLIGVPVGSLGPTRKRALARLQADPRLALAG